MKESEGGIVYRCKTCEQEIVVFVPAQVRCHKCKKRMRIVKSAQA